jgi:hypothetical protein
MDRASLMLLPHKGPPEKVLVEIGGLLYIRGPDDKKRKGCHNLPPFFRRYPITPSEGRYTSVMSKYLFLLLIVAIFVPLVGSAAYDVPPYPTESDKALTDAAGNVFLALGLAPVAALVVGAVVLYLIRKVSVSSRIQGSFARMATIVIVAIGACAAGYATFFAILSRPM